MTFTLRTLLFMFSVLDNTIETMCNVNNLKPFDIRVSGMCFLKKKKQISDFSVNNCR